jgi:Putative beta barrel porin-7 (BBP7)
MGLRNSSTSFSSKWHYGFRYLRIDDDLMIAARRAEEGGNEHGSYDVDAANNLYGGQVGVRLRRCCGLWSLEGTAKAGLYYNHADQSQTVTDFPNFRVRDTSSNDDNLAFLAELNASVIRQVADHCYVRAGYNLILIDGIALAPHQLDFTLTGTSGTATKTSGTMLLHGVNIGVEFRW